MSGIMDRNTLSIKLAASGVAVGPNLMTRYLRLAETRGSRTTPEDAYSAWLEWVKSAGGRESHPQSKRGSIHEQVAAVIREASAHEDERAHPPLC
jgi:hypothetical protein